MRPLSLGVTLLTLSLEGCSSVGDWLGLFNVEVSLEQSCPSGDLFPSSFFRGDVTIGAPGTPNLIVTGGIPLWLPLDNSCELVWTVSGSSATPVSDQSCGKLTITSGVLTLDGQQLTVQDTVEGVHEPIDGGTEQCTVSEGGGGDKE